MRILLFLCALLLSSQAWATPSIIAQNITDAKKIGTARLEYMFWDIYDATLYAPQGRWQPDGPFALRLDYLRRLKGPLIADRAIEEMQKQGFQDQKKLRQWRTEMAKIFPNVHEGDSITGLRAADGSTRFFLGDKAIGTITDQEFSKQFFAIWLGEKSSEPDMRKQLLGLK